MDADDRRAAIIAATREVIARQGVGFTTREVAEAAGVAEGTLFRAFASKDDLLGAVVDDLLDVTLTCERIESLGRDNTLEEQVGAVVAAVGDQVSAVHGAELAMACMSRLPDGTAPMAHLRGLPGPAASTVRASFDRLRAAVTGALAPYEARLRFSPEQVASWVWLSALAAAHPFWARIAHLNSDEVVHLLVHGIAQEDPDSPCC